MAAFTIPSIFTAIDKFSAPLKAMVRNTEAFAAKTEAGVARGERMFRKLTPALSGAAKEFLSFASAAAIASSIVGVGAFSVKSIMDYETALHSLEAVTGESSLKFKGQIESIAKGSNMSAIDVTKSFERIGSAMSQYLSDPKALGQIAEAGITLAKASRQELEPTLANLTSIMNQFDLGAEKALDTINRLTAGEIVGQVSTANMANALQQFGAVANANNVDLSQSVALVEVLGKKLPIEQLGTASRNLITFMSAAASMPKPAQKAMHKHGVDVELLMNKHVKLGDKLKELSKIQGDAVAMEAFFGRENMAAGTIILSNLAIYDEWEKKIRVTNEAEKQAALNSDTLANALTEVKNAFVNTLVSGGKLTPTMDRIKNVAFFIARNMDTIVTVGVSVLAFFSLWKGALIASRAALFLYNVYLGVYNAITKTAMVYTAGQTVAMNAQNIAAKAITVAQWLWNAAVSAFPIFILLGLAVTLGVIFDKYLSIEALHKKSLGKEKTQGIKDETEAVKAAAVSYQKYGRSVEEARKLALRDANKGLQEDLQKVNQKIAAASTDSERRVLENQLADIEGRKAALANPNEIFADQKPAVNPKLSEQDALVQKMEKNTKSDVTVDFKNVPQGVDISGDGMNSISPKLSSTLGF